MKVNLNDEREVQCFKKQITNYMQINEHEFVPYRLDDFTNKGANYTIFVPLKWEWYQYCAPALLRGMLRNEVDADKITIEYVDFVRE